jgi:type II secretory pathway pseudopilin PulG
VDFFIGWTRQFYRPAREQQRPVAEHALRRPYLTVSATGFTLVELTVVLFIVALLLGGMMNTMSFQREQQSVKETQRRLDEARDALMGYAAANGRLPCPASPAATGVENPDNGGACANPWNGFLPAVTLGITQVDAQGYALDGWEHPLRYAVTTANSNAFTTANGIKTAWSGVLNADLRICNTATGLTGSGASAECANNTTLSNSAVAVLYSRGKNGSATPSGADEVANGDSDRLFVSHPPAPASSGNEFDDLAIWLSPNLLFNRMIAAGRLP